MIRAGLLQGELGVDGVSAVSADLDVGHRVLEVPPDWVGLVRSRFQVWQLILDTEKSVILRRYGLLSSSTNIIAKHLFPSLNRASIDQRL